MTQVVSGAQIRAARGILRWSVRELADNSGVSVSTIKRLELQDAIPDTKMSILQAVHDALIADGKVRFEGETCVCIVKNNKQSQ